MMIEKWVENEDKLMRKLRREGYTVLAIAQYLGRTKSSVIGRMHRLGMCEQTKKHNYPVRKA